LDGAALSYRIVSGKRQSIRIQCEIDGSGQIHGDFTSCSIHGHGLTRPQCRPGKTIRMKTRLSSILRSMIVGGLVVCAAAKVLIQVTASPVPDPASGRTEPSLFAPAISTDWDYITPWQTWLLILLTGTVLFSFVAWLVVAWMERRADTADQDVPPDAAAHQFPARRIFGRQGR
jgi:hypothetical protein